MKKVGFSLTLVFIALVTLTWNRPTQYMDGSALPSSDSLTYKYYCSNSPVTSTIGPQQKNVGDVLTYNLSSDITTGKTWYCRMTAVNSAGEGGFSNEVSFFYPGIPGAPINLQVTF